MTGRSRLVTTCAAAFGALSLLPLAAHAQEGPSIKPTEPAVLTCVLENDVFAEQRADRHDSNGFQLSYLWALDRAYIGQTGSRRAPALFRGDLT